MNARLEQVYREQQGTRPTLRDILRVACAGELDRVALVRRPTNSHSAGVAVVMIGSPAIQAIGPMLLKHAADIEFDCGVHTSEPKDRAMVDGNSYMDTCFKWVDEKVPRWAWMHIKIDERPALIYIATARVTDEFAKELTNRGCPTKLT